MITAKNGEIRAEGSARDLLIDAAGIVSAVKSALVNAGTPEMVAFDLLTRTALVGFGAEGEVKEFSAVGVAPWMK